MPAQDELKQELYRTVLLLSTDPILARTLESWGAGAPDADTLQALRDWNEAKALELQEWLPSMIGQDMEAVQKKLGEYQASKAVQAA